jgi:Collagen triple helix repeat (20 copies)
MITSTAQIKPSVLKTLKGARGKSGAAGTAGAPGTLGATGPAGAGGATGSAGAAGAVGAAGAAGAAGTNGAVAGFSATGTSTTIPSGSNTDTFATVVSKSLPPGHFIVSGQADLTAQTSALPTFPGVEDECALFSAASNLASAESANAIGEYHFTTNEFLETSVVSVQAPVDLAATTTVSVQCELLLPLSGDQAAGFANTSTDASLTAVQTSANG